MFCAAVVIKNSKYTMEYAEDEEMVRSKNSATVGLFTFRNHCWYEMFGRSVNTNHFATFCTNRKHKTSPLTEYFTADGVTKLNKTKQNNNNNNKNLLEIQTRKYIQFRIMVNTPCYHDDTLFAFALPYSSFGWDRAKINAVIIVCFQFQLKDLLCRICLFVNIWHIWFWILVHLSWFYGANIRRIIVYF